MAVSYYNNATTSIDYEYVPFYINVPRYELADICGVSGDVNLNWTEMQPKYGRNRATTKRKLKRK